MSTQTLNKKDTEIQPEVESTIEELLFWAQTLEQQSEGKSKKEQMAYLFCVIRDIADSFEENRKDMKDLALRLIDEGVDEVENYKLHVGHSTRYGYNENEDRKELNDKKKRLDKLIKEVTKSGDDSSILDEKTGSIIKPVSVYKSAYPVVRGK